VGQSEALDSWFKSEVAGFLVLIACASSWKEYAVVGVERSMVTFRGAQYRGLCITAVLVTVLCVAGGSGSVTLGASTATTTLGPPSTTSPVLVTSATTSTSTTTHAGSSANPTTAIADGGLDPPDGDYPATGVCGLAEGAIGTVALGRGDFVPQPGCLFIRHDQLLRVVNDADIEVTVTLGTHLKATLAPSASITFAEPIGTYLAPGVHLLVFTAASAADIWVDPICAGPGATQCTSPP
jgi:hypothetical protein